MEVSSIELEEKLNEWRRSSLKGRHVSPFLGHYLTWDDINAKKIDRPTARPVQSTACQSHCRASASRTRVTGSNAKKATSSSGGSDPDPEPRRQPRLSGLLALRNVLTACRALIAANTYRSEVLA
ncbi:hypothetical protein GCM10011419_26720 [Vogesella fluminis]|uniref:Uncharacterized protein n=2 Tax=Vogesella fluminis TaxID=1069161 RepID=A0ABQ3HFP2_9NEIS|nr:hypothetical protein GCM10011419_26720 [Vogesella fluminis]